MKDNGLTPGVPMVIPLPRTGCAILHHQQRAYILTAQQQAGDANIETLAIYTPPDAAHGGRWTN